MPCNANLSIGYPTGGMVEVICSGGMGTLSTAYGNVSTSCPPSQVRGRINGGSWVTASVVASSFGGTYIAPWTLRNIPGATCDSNSDTLEVEVEVTDPLTGAKTWLTGSSSAFNAYCFMMPPPMRLHTTETMELELGELEVPSLLWGVVASMLAKTAVIKLKRQHKNVEGGVVWRSTGAAEGLWSLTAGSDKKAQLRLTVEGMVGGSSYEFEFLWGSGDFSTTKGGLFGPVGNNPITQTLSVRGKKGEQSPAIKPRPRGKARPKAARKSARKTRRAAKKRRGRR